MDGKIRAKMICKECKRELWWNEGQPGLIMVWPCTCAKIEIDAAVERIGELQGERDAEVGHKDARIAELMEGLRDQREVLGSNAMVIRSMLQIIEKAGLAVDRELLRSYEEQLDAVMRRMGIDGPTAAGSAVTDQPGGGWNFG